MPDTSRTPNIALYAFAAARIDTRAEFIALTTFDTEQGCWLWKGPLNEEGYGRFRFPMEGRTRSVFAHRLALHLAGRPVDADLTVDHTCHDPDYCWQGSACAHRRCVNPAHMETVDAGENSRRGRGRSKRPLRIDA